MKLKLLTFAVSAALLTSCSIFSDDSSSDSDDVEGISSLSECSDKNPISKDSVSKDSIVETDTLDLNLDAGCTVERSRMAKAPLASSLAAPKPIPIPYGTVSPPRPTVAPSFPIRMAS